MRYAELTEGMRYTSQVAAQQMALNIRQNNELLRSITGISEAHLGVGSRHADCEGCGAPLRARCCDYCRREA